MAENNSTNQNSHGSPGRITEEENDHDSSVMNAQTADNENPTGSPLSQVESEAADDVQ